MTENTNAATSGRKSRYEIALLKADLRLKELQIRREEAELERKKEEFKGDCDALRLAKLHSLAQLLQGTVLDEAATLPGSEPAAKAMIEDDVDRNRINHKIFQIISNLNP